MDRILKLSGSLLTVKLSCCDCAEVKAVEEGICVIPPTGLEQGWAKLVLIALERYRVELKRLTFNFR